MLNPVNHALDQEAADRYRVEPYVVAADIYSVGPLAGRGGWTWYTGSAGWLYRAAVEGDPRHPQARKDNLGEAGLAARMERLHGDAETRRRHVPDRGRARAGLDQPVMEMDGKQLQRGTFVVSDGGGEFHIKLRVG